MPEVEDPLCTCGEEETVFHVLQGCGALEEEDSQELAELGPYRDLLRGLRTGEKVKPILRWFSKRLPMYRVASLVRLRLTRLVWLVRGGKFALKTTPFVLLQVFLWLF